jgi:hypothetical protein
VPGETVGSADHAGGVNVLYGSLDGFSATGSQWFDQDTPGVIDSPEGGDRFGRVLAAWSAPPRKLYLPLAPR